jgi:hypothetical protein
MVHVTSPPWHARCNLCSMGASATFLDRSETAISHPPASLISRLGQLLNRPLLTGCAAAVASLFCCGVLARGVPLSELKPQHAAVHTAATVHPRATHHGEFPPLFLAMLGLAALALAQTPSSETATANRVDSCAGKNVKRGQKLPKILAPQPVLPPLDPTSSVVAGEHHDDIVRLQPISGLGMLHQ